MVKYTAGEDLGLDMRALTTPRTRAAPEAAPAPAPLVPAPAPDTDDSDVTFNMCLGRVFSGAKLTLCGDSRTPEHRQFYHHYEHVRASQSSSPPPPDWRVTAHALHPKQLRHSRARKALRAAAQLPVPRLQPSPCCDAGARQGADPPRQQTARG